MNSYRIPIDFLPHPASMRVSGPFRLHRVQPSKGVYFFMHDNNLDAFSTSKRCGRNRQSRPNEINHLRSDSYRSEYRLSRPMRQSRNHGRKAVNPYSNIADSGPASARLCAPQFQRKGAL